MSRLEQTIGYKFSRTIFYPISPHYGTNCAKARVPTWVGVLLLTIITICMNTCWRQHLPRVVWFFPDTVGSRLCKHCGIRYEHHRFFLCPVHAWCTSVGKNYEQKSPELSLCAQQHFVNCDLTHLPFSLAFCLAACFCPAVCFQTKFSKATLFRKYLRMGPLNVLMCVVNSWASFLRAHKKACLPLLLPGQLLRLLSDVENLHHVETTLIGKVILLLVAGVRVIKVSADKVTLLQSDKSSSEGLLLPKMCKAWEERIPKGATMSEMLCSTYDFVSMRAYLYLYWPSLLYRYRYQDKYEL